jgi:hypothetical protein
MNTFDSLTLALENWFEASLCDLPDSLRQRVKKEFAPMPWDQLSAEQRRTVTLQLDYQQDPATEQDRQFWWDHVQRQNELKAQIAQWEVAAAPTAGELALRETRLKELRQELARTEAQDRQAKGDYIPVRTPRDRERETPPISQGSPVLYIAYPKALAQLRNRLDATPEELAAWVWLGPKIGGIAAYVNANELDPPPRFHFREGSGRGDDHDYVAPLMACWFRVDEIADFNPADRFITGAALIKRWSERPGLRAEAWVRAKIRESRLLDLHPLYGDTQAGSPDDASLPPMTAGLFRLSEVEAIEVEDFADDHAVSGAAVRPAPTQEEEAVAFGSMVASNSDTGVAEPSLPDMATGVLTDPAKVEPGGIAQVSEATDSAQIVANEASTSSTPIADLEVGSREWRRRNAQAAANAMHDRPGGSRDKQRQIREVWASGKYSDRDTCAEQECAALGMPYSTARKALRGTPDPTRS